MAPGNKLRESHQGPVEPECSMAVGLKPEQLEGCRLHFAAGREGR